MGSEVLDEGADARRELGLRRRRLIDHWRPGKSRGTTTAGFAVRRGAAGGVVRRGAGPGAVVRGTVVPGALVPGALVPGGRVPGAVAPGTGEVVARTESGAVTDVESITGSR